MNEKTSDIILSNQEIKKRCKEALKELHFASGKLIIKRYFNENEKFYPSAGYRGTEPRKISTSKIGKIMYNDPEFTPVRGGGNQKTWGLKKEWTKEVET